MIKKKDVLKVAVYDLDDNILKTDTKIYGFENISDKDLTGLELKEIKELVDLGLVKEREFSTNEFASAKENPKEFFFDYTGDAFSNFRDTGRKGRHAFIDDVRDAIKNKNFAPSWDKFKNSLKNGNLISICTARGAEPNTLKELARMIINNDDIANQGFTRAERHNLVEFMRQFHTGKDQQVIEKYLNDCEFCGITSDYFAKKFNKGVKVNPSDPSEYKKQILTHFFVECNKIANRFKLSLFYSFSDDDNCNVVAISDLFKELNQQYDEVGFAVFDTSNGKNVKYKEYIGHKFME